MLKNNKFKIIGLLTTGFFIYLTFTEIKLIKIVLSGKTSKNGVEIPQSTRFMMLFAVFFIAFIMYVLFTFAINIFKYKIDRIITEPTSKRVATVNSVKKSGINLIERVTDKETGYIVKRAKSTVTFLLTYDIYNETHENKKLTITIYNYELERFKDIKNLPILINQENYKDISIDWEWLGRDRITF